MKLLAGTHYDPSGIATKLTNALLAMTAMDTTNLRLTFTAPSNGAVLIRLRAPMTGAASSAQVLLGILDHTNSDAVLRRQAPLTSRVGASTSAATVAHADFVVSGLTAGQSYTYDAAWGVEFVVASSSIKYGGTDDNTANNAFGGISYEIWDAPGLLGAVTYDPSTAVVSQSLGSGLQMTAIDTTNLRLTFTGPSRGIVYVRVRGVVSGTTAAGYNSMFGVLDGATVRFRARGGGGFNEIASSPVATDQLIFNAQGIVTGLTGGTSYTWDAAYGVESTQASAVLKYGGPNNTTQDDAWGGLSFDVWNADSLPTAIGWSA